MFAGSVPGVGKGSVPGVGKGSVPELVGAILAFSIWLKISKSCSAKFP